MAQDFRTASKGIISHTFGGPGKGVKFVVYWSARGLRYTWRFVQTYLVEC